MPAVTWLGDGDPSAQIIECFGRTFVKGEPEPFAADDPVMVKLSTNPLFSSEPDAAPTSPDEAAEKDAIKQLLRDKGQEVKGNPSLDTLRDRLAKLVD